MNIRTIGIGIVAVALILAISMTASARPDPEGATTQYLGTWGTTGAATGDFTDGQTIGAAMEIQLLVTVAVDDSNPLIVQVAYTDQGSASDTTGDITIPAGTIVGTYVTVALASGDTGVLDVTGVAASGSAATAGNFTIIATETASADAAGTDIARGGYITSVDLSASSQTVKWQGYFGEIDGTVTLEDASGNQMYEWNWVSEQGGTVFAVARESSAPIWTDTYNNDVTREELDSVWGYTGSDTAAITFDDPNGSTEFDVAGYTVPMDGRDALYTLLQNGSDSTFEEVLLTDQETVDGKEDFIFACRIDDDAADFQGSTSDYQLIVPDTIAADTTTTYYFYVEMS